MFQKTASTFKKNRQMARDGKRGPMTPEEIDKAHSAILGLGSFVACYPYHVPAFLPEILVVLTTHLHDPQPIPVTKLSKYFRLNTFTRQLVNNY